MRFSLLLIAMLVSLSAIASEPAGEEALAIAQSYIRGAHEGDPYAQHVASDMYWKGWGVEQNERLAKQWLEASAGQNYAPAIFELGRRKIFGEGYPRAVDDAKKLLESAVSLGSSEANVLLGTYYLGINFEEGPGDSELGRQYLLDASNAGNHFGSYYLGLMYEFGLEPNPNEFGEINFKQAINWYTKAAEALNYFAAGRLGLIYALPENYNLNMEKAYFWFKVAEKLGSRDWKGIMVDVELKLNAGARSRIGKEVESWESIHKHAKQAGTG